MSTCSATLLFVNVQGFKEVAEVAALCVLPNLVPNLVAFGGTCCTLSTTSLSQKRQQDDKSKLKIGPSTFAFCSCKEHACGIQALDRMAKNVMLYQLKCSRCSGCSDVSCWFGVRVSLMFFKAWNTKQQVCAFACWLERVQIAIQIHYADVGYFGCLSSLHARCSITLHPEAFCYGLFGQVASGSCTVHRDAPLPRPARSDPSLLLGMDRKATLAINPIIAEIAWVLRVVWIADFCRRRSSVLQRTQAPARVPACPVGPMRR